LYLPLMIAVVTIPLKAVHPVTPCETSIPIYCAKQAATKDQFRVLACLAAHRYGLSRNCRAWVAEQLMDRMGNSKPELER
jgi:hypothetical protein